MNQFLKAFNEVHEDVTPKNKFPIRIRTNELKTGFAYAIQEVVYVETVVHQRSVVLRVKDQEEVLRSYFMPEKYADIFRTNFADASTINVHELYLTFKGFKDEEKQMQPLLEILYKGNAQHPF